LDKVGILVISKCLSAAAMVDSFSRSERYTPEFYVVEKQVNPFNSARAKVHMVVPDLDIRTIIKFVTRYREELAFGLTDTEDFVTAGGRDEVERETGVPMLCVTRKYAVEKSKADQRLLFEEVFPGANPRYRVFDPKAYSSVEDAVSEFRRLAEEIEVVIKPDAPARGAGVGVWGSDFRTETEMVAFFRNVLAKGRVVVEERVDGEESSFQAFSDGRHFFAAPLTRDYKRGLEGNKGKLTGGMGSYRDSRPFLPFLTLQEWERLVAAEEEAFRRWKGTGSNPELRGIVLYDAIMHTGQGFRVLERNSRGGNTEQINVLATLEEDFVDVCYRMVEGDLKGLRFGPKASVVTCVVPAGYGLPEVGPRVEARKVDLRRATQLEKKFDGSLRVLPMDLRLENGDVYVGSSRSVAVVGIGRSLEDARDISLQGVDSIVGPLRCRRDIATQEDIQRSIEHMRSLRGRPAVGLNQA
jgi:phosphoribosylamine---glycine ligase